MTDWLMTAAIVASDVAVIAALWWRGHGRPLPRRLEWARTHRATRWLFALFVALAVAVIGWLVKEMRAAADQQRLHHSPRATLTSLSDEVLFGVLRGDASQGREAILDRLLDIPQIASDAEVAAIIHSGVIQLYRKRHRAPEARRVPLRPANVDADHGYEFFARLHHSGSRLRARVGTAAYADKCRRA